MSAPRKRRPSPPGDRGVFATNLQRLLEERDISVREVARLAKMKNPSTLSDLMQGATAEPTLATVFAVADALKVDESILTSRRVGAAALAGVVKAYLADPISEDLHPEWSDEDLRDLQRRGTVFWVGEPPIPVHFHEMVELARRVRRRLADRKEPPPSTD